MSDGYHTHVLRQILDLPQCEFMARVPNMVIVNMLIGLDVTPAQASKLWMVSDTRQDFMHCLHGMKREVHH